MMKGGRHVLISILFLCVFTAAAAREWRSADGKQTFEAVFVGLKGNQLLLAPQKGKPSLYPITAFAAEDQNFAKNAQAIAESALKMGPQSFEVTLTLDEGCLCRMALSGNPTKVPLIYAGETFFLVGAGAEKKQPGSRVSEQLLFGAGNRTFYPIQGTETPIRAFSLVAEEAMRVWSETAGSGDPTRQSPPVIEPEIKVITLRSMGLVLSKTGLVLAPAWIVENADTLFLHIQGKDEPATAVKTDAKLGASLISSKIALNPGRFGAKKPVEMGQNIFAISYELSSRAKSIGTPALTRGIVSKVSGTTSFLHDAAVPPDTIGGLITGDKGDVLGVFFPPPPADKNGAKSTSATAQPTEGLTECLLTSGLANFLAETQGASAMKSSPSGEIHEIADALRGSCVPILATRKVQIPRQIVTKKAAPQPAAGGGPATGFSISTQGVRHNAQCRYFSPARPCAATDGRPCKTCGG